MSSKDSLSDDSSGRFKEKGGIEPSIIDVGAVDDKAIQYADVDIVLSPSLEKRLIRKADMYVCSIMCFVYAIQYMDKISNNAAAVMGLRTDLHMTGHMYSWVGSAFYLGYLIFEIPVSFSLQRFPLAKTTAVFIIGWGAVLTCSAASQNYAGFMVTRTLLGILEGGITPSFLLLTSQWYRREEQYSRVCIWFSWNGIGTILGSAIAYGLYVHSASYSIDSWRILFMILGLITIVFGIIFYFHMPDTPSDAWFLTEEEKAGQVARIRDNKQGYGTSKIKWAQVKETFLDLHTYLHFAIVFLMQVPNGGLTNFSNILYQGMGFDVRKTLEISMAQGAAQLISASLAGFLSLYFFRHYRMVYAYIGALSAFAGCALLAWCPTNAGKLAGIFMFSGICPIAYNGILSNISSNVAGSTKKSISGATLFIGYAIGNLIGPQTFKQSENPTYNTAKVAMAGCTGANIVLFLVLTFYNVYLNKKRDQKNEKLPDNIIHGEFADLTDMTNPEFRYAL